MNKSKILRVAAVLGAVAIIGAAAMSVGPTYAARGGKHGGGQTGGGGTGTCSVAPNPMVVGSDYTVTGTGYAPSQLLTVSVTESNGTSWAWKQADANGTFSAGWRTYTVGTGLVRVYDSVSGAYLNGCSFQVT